MQQSFSTTVHEELYWWSDSQSMILAPKVSASPSNLLEMHIQDLMEQELWEGSQLSKKLPR